ASRTKLLRSWRPLAHSFRGIGLGWPVHAGPRPKMPLVPARSPRRMGGHPSETPPQPARRLVQRARPSRRGALSDLNRSRRMYEPLAIEVQAGVHEVTKFVHEPQSAPRI